MITLYFDLAANMFDSILAIWFTTKFCDINTKKKLPSILFVILVFMFTMLSDKYLANFNTVSVIIAIILIVIYTVVVTKRISIKSVLCACFFWITLMVVSSLLFVCMTYFSINYDELTQGSNTPIRYIYVLLHKIILFAILKLVLSFFSLDGQISKLNAILTFSISLVTVFGLGTAMYIATLNYSRVTTTHIAIITVAFVMTNVILYVMLSQIQRLQKSEYELKLLEEKIESENARHEDATALWQNVRNIQHDVKHHLSLISAQLEAGDVEASKDYIHKLLPSLDMMGRIIKSDNKILDYIINSKLGSLKDTQIIVSGSIGDISDIADKDMASLLGNILDNAVEAIADLTEKRIELFFSIENTSRMIICKNTIGKSVLHSNPKLNSTKKDKSSHGFGHRIIENIVKDYHGMVDYFEEDDYFGVQVVLPAPEVKK